MAGEAVALVAERRADVRSSVAFMMACLEWPACNWGGMVVVVVVVSWFGHGRSSLWPKSRTAEQRQFLEQSVCQNPR